jgi:hypothetical protein
VFGLRVTQLGVTFALTNQQLACSIERQTTNSLFDPLTLLTSTKVTAMEYRTIATHSGEDFVAVSVRELTAGAKRAIASHGHAIIGLSGGMHSIKDVGKIFFVLFSFFFFFIIFC